MSKATDCECGIDLIDTLLHAAREAAKSGWAGFTDDIVDTLEASVPDARGRIMLRECDTGLNPGTFIRFLGETTDRERENAATGLLLTILESAVGYLEDCKSAREEGTAPDKEPGKSWQELWREGVLPLAATSEMKERLMQGVRLMEGRDAVRACIEEKECDMALNPNTCEVRSAGGQGLPHQALYRDDPDGTWFQIRDQKGVVALYPNYYWPGEKTIDDVVKGMKCLCELAGEGQLKTYGSYGHFMRSPRDVCHVSERSLRFMRAENPNDLPSGAGE